MPSINTRRGTFRIADHRHDKATLPSIVIHGAGGSHLTFPKEIRQLKSANGIFPDLSGHGLSKGNGHRSIDDYADDIVALMDALDIPEAIIMGHSMGGAIAQTLALNYASRVYGIVLIATGARLKVNPALLDGIVKNPNETIAQINQWMWARNVPDEIRDKSAEMMRQMKPSIIQGDYIASDRFNSRQQLEKITAPTLVIGGEQDKMTRPSLSEELADKIPDSQLVILDDAGHMLMLEQPEKTATIIDEWINHIKK